MWCSSEIGGNCIQQVALLSWRILYAPWSEKTLWLEPLSRVYGAWDRRGQTPQSLYCNAGATMNVCCSCLRTSAVVRMLGETRCWNSVGLEPCPKITTTGCMGFLRKPASQQHSIRSGMNFAKHPNLHAQTLHVAMLAKLAATSWPGEICCSLKTDSLKALRKQC